jgi:hypothetical protein
MRLTHRRGNVMRLILVPILLASTATAASPADRMRSDYSHVVNARQAGQRPEIPERSDWARQEPNIVVNFARDFDRVKGRIRPLARRGIISPGEAADLRREAREIGAQLRRSGRGGLREDEFSLVLDRADRFDRRVGALVQRGAGASPAGG